jgi:hypothetical protein
MFLQSETALLNIATVRRWGIKLGTVFLSFQKLEDESSVKPPAAS